MTCRCQSRFSYLLESTYLESVRTKFNNSKKEVSKLKVEMAMLKTEIDKKVNELTKVHLKELLELQTENVSLRQEVGYLSESLGKANKENCILQNSTKDMRNKIEVIEETLQIKKTNKREPFKDMSVLCVNTNMYIIMKL